MKSHTFSPADFETFRAAVAQWITRLGLTEWEYECEHEQIGDGINAVVSSSNVGKRAIFRLTKTWEGDYSLVTDPAVLAQHEVLHLLLSALVWTAAYAKSDEADAVNAREHEVVRRLMRVIPPVPLNPEP